MPDTDTISGTAPDGAPGTATGGPAGSPTGNTGEDTGVNAMAELRDLHREDRLAAEYPRAAGLLGGLTGEELATAGRLLARLDPDDVARAHPDVPAVTVAVTGHCTLAPLIPALTAETARHGLLLRPHVGDFDGYVFELGDPSGALYAADPDLVLCVLDPGVVLDELPAPWQVDDVARAFDERLRVIEGLAARFAQNARGTLVLNTLPLPRRVPAQLVELRARARLGAAWRAANARLLALAEDNPSVVVLDLDPLLAAGVPAEEPRMRVYAKAGLSTELLTAYAREIGHLARHLTGRTKKVLALDLDDTLWGGVLGEDGADGVEVAGGYRGEAFRAFQRVVLQLGSQGVLLAAVSKNDVEPVRHMLTGHPAMTLKEEHFVRVMASWRPKHESLAELADALNLGLDSFVFTDDSPYECGLVRHALPAVTVVQVDREPALHVERLLADGWFDAREVTAEDRGRVAKYRDELVRKDFLDGFDSLDDYLRELGVRVELFPAGAAELPRVSQLTLRTNQFNLTTERLQPERVRELVDDPAALVLAVRSADRFGDNGLVGAILAHRDGDVLHVDNFLLSCRVFSRGIEQACLAALLRHARATGAAEVRGTYRKTAKNGKVKDFYTRYGFAPAGDDGTASAFRHDLADIVEPPPHVRLTATFEGSAHEHD